MFNPFRCQSICTASGTSFQELSRIKVKWKPNCRICTRQFFTRFLVPFVSNQRLKVAKTRPWVVLFWSLTSWTYKADMHGNSIKYVTNRPFFSVLLWSRANQQWWLRPEEFKFEAKTTTCISSVWYWYSNNNKMKHSDGNTCTFSTFFGHRESFVQFSFKLDKTFSSSSSRFIAFI